MSYIIKSLNYKNLGFFKIIKTINNLAYKLELFIFIIKKKIFDIQNKIYELG